MSSENNITTCDSLEITSRPGEIEAVERVSGSGQTGPVFFPFSYAKGTAHTLTYPALYPASKTPEFRVSAAKLSKLN